MATLYDPITDRSRLAQQAVAAAPWEASLLRKVVDATSGEGLPTVVDIGCADGRLTTARAELADRPTVTVGVDVSAEAIRAARERYPEHTWVHGTPSAVDVVRVAANADVVWAARAVQHVEDVEAFIASAWRLVRPGGALVLVWPDDRHTASTSTDPQLSWLLSGMPGLVGVSDRYVTEAVLATVAGLGAHVEVDLHPSALRPSDDGLDVVFD